MEAMGPYLPSLNQHRTYTPVGPANIPEMQIGGNVGNGSGDGGNVGNGSGDGGNVGNGSGDGGNVGNGSGDGGNVDNGSGEVDDKAPLSPRKKVRKNIPAAELQFHVRFLVEMVFESQAYLSLQKILRAYLVNSGVLRKGDITCMPPCPDSEDVMAFEVDHINGPNITKALVDWRSSLKSEWNKELIHLLARDVQPQLIAAKPPLPPTMIAMPNITSTIDDKLYRVRLELNRLFSSSMDAVACRVINRRRSRRVGVSLTPQFFDVFS
jgi:hypothetical protein